MRTLDLWTTAAVALLLGATSLGGEEKVMTTMKMKKLTPVLFMAAIEPCLGFWTERLGFEKTVEVPEGNKLGFVILARDGVEVMYQTYASAEKDIPGLVRKPNVPGTFLYLEVTGLDDIKQRLAGVKLEVPERKTFYGAREIGVREPGGNLILFAEMAAAPVK